MSARETTTRRGDVVLRAALIAVGVAAGLWGLWLMRTFRSDQVRSLVEFVVGGVVLHDAVLAPLTLLVGLVIARVAPGVSKKVVVVAVVLWGTVTVAVANVLSGKGGKPDNDTVLNRPYLLSWLVLSLALAVAGVAIAVVRSRRRSMR